MHFLLLFSIIWGVSGLLVIAAIFFLLVLAAIFFM
jgi:hypothetical protein